MLFWFGLISADPSKVLVCTVNSRRTQQSYLLKLFGDPEQYAFKLGNHTFAGKHPIHIDSLKWKRNYGFYSSISLDQKQQRVWFGNKVEQFIQFGRFIYKTSGYEHPTTYYATRTNQVLQHN